jgi:broad specificity phosphatase PhoE
MTVIYIRHGDDSNSDSIYTNDPTISKNDYPKIRNIGKNLIKKYGHPDLILVSPMFRTIETCGVFKDLFDQPCHIKVSPELSRLFTSKQRNPRTIHPRTLKHNPPLHEDSRMFKNRVDDHIETMFKNKYYKRTKPVIWCITHALVIKRVAKRFHYSTGKIDFLETFTIVRDQ